MLSNAYFLAKFRFDTAENEPAKNLHKFAKFAPLDRVSMTPPGRVAASATMKVRSPGTVFHFSCLSKDAGLTAYIISNINHM